MRLIDADALRERKFVGVADWTPTEATSWQRGWNDAIETIIDAQPTVDAEPVRHGYWNVVKSSIHPYGNDVACSVCGFNMGSSFGYRFCPICGAKMDGERREDENRAD